jgi:hypothetical protein
MSPNPTAPARRKSPTQPLGWDWVSDWSSIDQGLSALEARHALAADEHQRPERG